MYLFDIKNLKKIFIKRKFYFIFDKLFIQSLFYI